ncbi:MAG: LysM peptidoglycan-binding domain-containing protein [Hymenobacteraceae bacterium]|nr:LysM peptidoglycan-binding domain-containing protein [Hymenobacteraceae bacterium]
MKKYFFLLLSLLVFTASAQTVVVPHNVYFADQHLEIKESGRKEIQRMVDALHKHPSYFKLKVDLADMYFPIIERIFKEEGVPEDFKFLALQESGLASDAVSTSNAVGYWQFKKEAASDFSLRVDQQVDERKHIISSTRGAAKYLKRSNNYYQNWTNTLLTYNLGYTGAKSYTRSSDIGSRKMDITDKTHPYVLTFLAHKIAYENFVGKNNMPPVVLKELKAKPGQSLSEIALATQTDPAELERYNKWLAGSTVPADKPYVVILPVANKTQEVVVASAEQQSPAPTTLSSETPGMPKAEFTNKNNLRAVIARKGDNKDKLALAAGISTRKLLKYNDLHSFDPIIEGEVYYIEKKRTKAHVEYYTVEKDETLQQIAQKFGVRESSIRYKNRLAKNQVLLEGRLLWMQNRRPSNIPVEYRKVSTTGAAVASEKYVAPKKKSFFEKVGDFLGFNHHTTDIAEVETDSVLEAENTDNEVDENLTAINEDETEESATDEGAEEETPAPATASTPAVPTKAVNTSSASTTTPSAVEQENDEEETHVITLPATTNPNLYPGKKDSATTTAGTTTAKQAETPAATKPKTEPAVTKPASTATVKPATASTPAKPAQTADTKQPATEKTVAATKAVQPEKPAPVTTTHTVAKGETLFGISRKYNITVDELKQWNKLGDAPLALGQSLYVSAPAANATKPAATATTKPAAAKVTTHTIVTGETLFAIAQRYNISIDDLKAWNKLPASGAINVGDELRLTAPATATTTPVTTAKNEAPVTTTNATITHTVAEGESMYQISRKYNVTIKDIMEWNKKPDFNVSQGEKLMIKPKAASN